MVDYTNHEGDAKTRRSRRFWLHLYDNLFRRLIWYIIPVVFFGAVGVVLAQGLTDNYSSSATLDAANNPFVSELTVRGEETLFRQTPAQSTANFVNEQLRTDAFTAVVAEAAGLSAPIESGLIGLGDIRSAVAVRANGDSLVVIEAKWSDPQTAQLLSQATITSYRNYIVDTVAADSLAAEQFYLNLEERALEQAAAAEDALDSYVSSLPDLDEDEMRTIEQELTIERLNNSLERAETNVETARAEIEAAQLQVAQSRSEAGESIRLIDSPGLPVSPESQRNRMVSIVLMFLLLGLLTSGTALIATTALDHTVRFTIELSDRIGSPYATSVPMIRSLKSQRSRRSEVGKTSASKSLRSPDQAHQDDPDVELARTGL